MFDRIAGVFSNLAAQGSRARGENLLKFKVWRIGLANKIKHLTKMELIGFIIPKTQ